MKRGTVRAFLGTVVLTATLAVAAPASAGEQVHRACSGDAGITGSTDAGGQITFLAGLGFGTCGKLGVRVNYTHVGGASWTAWKYTGDQPFVVEQNVKNAVRSEHSSVIGPLKFLSYR